MPVDALFEKLRLAERRLTAAEERVVFCRAAAAKASAVLGGECVSRSRDVTANENAVIRLMEAEQEYAEAEREYGDLRSQVCSLLQRIDDPMNADILKLRYVEHKRMPAIAKELHLSRSSIYSRHEIALSELQDILQTQFT
jgi:DNA-directed RNA polymerase specialized sigma subunit